MNTTHDLRREVADRLYSTLHGETVAESNAPNLDLPHMLGIVPIGAISTPEVERGTLLDCDHEFWESYQRDINTRNAVEQEIVTAMEILQEEGRFTVTNDDGDLSIRVPGYE